MVMQLLVGFNVLVVVPSLPVKSVQELIDYAKNNSDKLTFGSNGNGSSQHIAGELFKLLTGTQMVHAPYKGSAQADTDLIGGRVQLIFENVGPILPHIKAGRVRALGVTGLRRSSVLPDVPPISEVGVPGYELTTFTGVIVPAGVPKAIVAKLNAESNKAIALPGMKEKYAAIGYELVGGTSEQFDALVKKEIVKWADIVKRAGVKTD